MGANTMPKQEDDTLKGVMPALERRARRLAHTPEDAADLAQECALRLWAHTRAGTRIDDMEAYGMTVLRNLARSAWRAREPMLPLDDAQATIPPDAPARLALADLRAAVDRLPPEQAALMRLVLGGETSPARLAEITGQPPGTVMSRLSRARARLRRDTDQPFGVEPAS